MSIPAMAPAGVFAPNAAHATSLRSNVEDGESSRVRTAATEFEATFLAMILKEMRNADEPDGLFAGDSGDVLGGLFDQTMGGHLAAAGGVGLAASLATSLRAPVPPSRTSPTHG